MAKLYYDLIKLGKWSIDKVPQEWKSDVEAMLQKDLEAQQPPVSEQTIEEQPPEPSEPPVEEEPDQPAEEEQPIEEPIEEAPTE